MLQLTERNETNWIQTAGGRKFYPLDPRPEDVTVEDIAHALSKMCRFNGHTSSFYSVAQHSVIVSRIVPAEHALAGLLHDATEAYLADITRPVKQYMPDFAVVEDLLMECIAERFRLPMPMDPCVKKADLIALNMERRDLFRVHHRWTQTEGAGIRPERIVPLDPEASRIEFLQRFREVTR